MPKTPAAKTYNEEATEQFKTLMLKILNDGDINNSELTKALGAGANPNVIIQNIGEVDKPYYTPLEICLHYAIPTAYTTADLLLANGADINLYTIDNDNNLLEQAVRDRNIENSTG